MGQVKTTWCCKLALSTEWRGEVWPNGGGSKAKARLWGKDESIEPISERCWKLSLVFAACNLSLIPESTNPHFRTNFPKSDWAPE